MNYLKIAYRNLLKNKRNSFIKILSLSVGFAIGLVLLAKISFETNFDNFYPDSKNIYNISLNFISLENPDAAPSPYPRVSGGVVPGMVAELPEVEAGTRFSQMGEIKMISLDQKEYKARMILADSNYFDVLPRLILAGQGKATLSKPSSLLVSQKIAKIMGGNVINKQIKISDKEYTIGGVFEDMPLNSSHKFDVIISLSSISNFMGDGTNLWVGNERYFGYLKLKPNTNLSNMPEQMSKVLDKYQGIEEVKKMINADMSYSLTPIGQVYKNKSEVKNMVLMLSILCIVLLLTAVMNYILFAITAVVEKAKNTAIHKCYGADNTNIGWMMFTEVLIEILISLSIASLLIFLSKGVIEDLLSRSFEEIFNYHSLMILAAVVIFIIIVTSITPVYLVSRLPIASVFRSFKKNRKAWRLALLFVQFIAATFLLILLYTTISQYNMMLNNDPGYDYKKLLGTGVGNLDAAQVSTIENRLQELPEVESTSRASTLPLWGPSGNMVSFIGGDQSLFSAADLEYVGHNYLKTINVPLLEGEGFGENTQENSIMIDDEFAKKLQTSGMKGSVVGQDIRVSGGYGDRSKIMGVYKKHLLGSARSIDSRPSMMFYHPNKGSILYIRMKEINQGNIEKIDRIMSEVVPGRENIIDIFSEFVESIYKEDKKFKNSVMISSIITLLITIIGLIGYLNNEVVQRSAEIAIRRINGAELKNIFSLFIKNIFAIAIPGVIIGTVLAYFASSRWLENYALKIDLSVFIFGLLGLLVLAGAVLIVIAKCYRVTSRNPVESLKNE